MSSQPSIYLAFVALLTCFSTIRAHTIITYPGWRGDTLHSNGTVGDTNGLAQLATANGDILYPYGMQWMYPCGGMPISQNRTKWPVKGGAVAFQPGWFPGHASAFIYINLGFGNTPLNYSAVMVNGIQIVGPTNNPYPGTFCLPQVPLPANTTVKVGDNATIQLIEAAVHGAALYNCVDITFAEPEDVAEVNEANCFNSTQIKTALVFTTSSLESAATSLSSPAYSLVSVVIALAYAYLLI